MPYPKVMLINSKQAGLIAGVDDGSASFPWSPITVTASGTKLEGAASTASGVLDSGADVSIRRDPS